mmetsp:Transcript_25671/g.53216  ORF Transcript_25671/g.53216 Transcript_25671/m.53216 type:complete len:318 (+) Transcript_25671:324-1277(+)
MQHGTPKVGSGAPDGSKLGSWRILCKGSGDGGLLALRKLLREEDFDLDEKVSKTGRIVAERHALALDLQNLKGPRDALGAYLHGVPVQVPDGPGPPQEGLAEAHLHRHVQIVALALELWVLAELQRQDDAAGQLARSLLCHPGEGQLLAVLHALLYLHVDRRVLRLAALLAWHLLLLLHEHARAHLHVDGLLLVGAPGAAPALGRLGPRAAAPADHAALQAGLLEAAVVEVLEADVQARVHVLALLHLALLVALHRLHAAGVVEDLPVGVVEDLVGVPDLRKLPLGLLVGVLVGVVLDRQLPVHLLDVDLLGIIREA